MAPLYRFFCEALDRHCVRMNMYLVVFIFLSLMFYVVILLQRSRMSDDSETVEDTKKASLAEVTDDSCTVEFIEIVPLDDYHRPGFIPPVFEVKPEDLYDVKQEATDDSNVGGDAHCYVKQEPHDEGEIDAQSFSIKVSCQAIIAIVELSSHSSVYVSCRFVFSALLLFIVNRYDIRASA